MFKTIQILALTIAVHTFAAEAHGQNQEMPRGRHHGMKREPPFLKDLTSEQRAQFESASTHEERESLLKSWGIELPPRPPGGPGMRHGPPPMSEENKTQMNDLQTQFESAQTDEERESIRTQMRELFQASQNETERDGVRRFLKDHPGNFRNTGSSGRAPSSAGIQ